MTKLSKLVRVTVLGCLVTFGACVACAADFTGFAGTSVHFASVGQARIALGVDDSWIAATTDVQRAATMTESPPVSRDRFLAYLSDTALAWSVAEQARWSKALTLLAPRFAALKIELPKKVTLVATNGLDAANSPYTRGSAVFIPLAFSDSSYSDEEMLAHELFHVMTRYHPELATQLDEAIGFELVAPLDWPAEWLALRIANPDTPFDRHAMRITSANAMPKYVMPLLVANREQVRAGETFFDIMDIRLLSVVPGCDGRPTRPLMRDGQPVWQPAASVAPYLLQLGGNTPYIIHPEETLADNFAFLVSKRPVRNKPLLQRIEAILLASP